MNIVYFFQTLTTDTFIIYRVFVKLHIHRYWTQLMPIISLLLTREPGNILHRKNLSITADISAVFDLILWIHSLEFQTHCLAVVNCLFFVSSCSSLLLPVYSKCCLSRSHVLFAKNCLSYPFLHHLTWCIWRIIMNYMTEGWHYTSKRRGSDGIFFMYILRVTV